jgi:hypothetical protein
MPIHNFGQVTKKGRGLIGYDVLLQEAVERELVEVKKSW